MKVLKNKYIHIVNNIVCVFQMSIIMEILSMYVITDKQKDVSHIREEHLYTLKCYLNNIQEGAYEAIYEKLHTQSSVKSIGKRKKAHILSKNYCEVISG
jgi:beta-glucosidase/6-phospho-beta-glucosidase/beta-galactosidase